MMTRRWHEFAALWRTASEVEGIPGEDTTGIIMVDLNEVVSISETDSINETNAILASGAELTLRVRYQTMRELLLASRTYSDS